MQAQADSGHTPVQGLTKFRERHFQLMIAYNQAVCPDFNYVSLSILFEYHQWLMEKLLEGEWSPDAVYEYMKADFKMRTRWMLSWQRKEYGTFGEIITYRCAQSAYLFADIRSGRVRSRSRSRSRRAGQRGRASGGDDNHREHDPKSGGSDKVKTEWKGLERTNANGLRRCAFFNKAPGCKKVTHSADVHECDFPGCGKYHARAENHPLKPP